MPVITRKGGPYHVVLEGGSIDVNGQGLMLTSEECLLSTVQQRNPGCPAKILSPSLPTISGWKKIWLGSGIAGDDTHGHIDDIARFIAPDTVLAAVEHNRGDRELRTSAGKPSGLRAATDQRGRKLQILELPLPRPEDI